MTIIIGFDGRCRPVSLDVAIATTRRYCLEWLISPRPWLLSPGPWQQPERETRCLTHLDGPLARKLARVGGSRARARRCVKALRKAGVQCAVA